MSKVHVNVGGNETSKNFHNARPYASLRTLGEFDVPEPLQAHNSSKLAFIDVKPGSEVSYVKASPFLFPLAFTIQQWMNSFL